MNEEKKIGFIEAGKQTHTRSGRIIVSMKFNITENKERHVNVC